MKRKKSSALATIPSDQHWRVESDLSTLMEAEKIKSDPKRLAAAQALAKERGDDGPDHPQQGCQDKARWFMVPRHDEAGDHACQKADNDGPENAHEIAPLG